MKQSIDVSVEGSSQWKLIARAYSPGDGWRKSTHALEIPGVGCLVQVTAEHFGVSGRTTDVALTAVPGVSIEATTLPDGSVTYRLVEARELRGPLVAGEVQSEPPAPVQPEAPQGEIEPAPSAALAVTETAPVEQPAETDRSE